MPLLNRAESIWFQNSLRAPAWNGSKYAYSRPSRRMPSPQRGLKEVAGAVQGGEIVRPLVELAPDGDHDVRVRRVDRADHAGRVRKPDRIEAMGAPLIDRLGGPILPVLHDVIEGDAPAPEAGHDVQQLLLVLVVVAGLPEAEGPAGQHRGPPGQGAEAGDDAVQRGALDKIIVDAIADIGPKGDRRPGRPGGLPEEAQDIRALAVGLELQGVAGAGLEADLELVVFRGASPGASGRPPACRRARP